MNNISKISLCYIVPTFVFFIFTLLQGGFFLYEYQHDQTKLYNEKEQYIKGITGNLQTTLSNSLMRLQKAQAQNIVLETALDENIKIIAVIDHNQQIVISNSMREKYMFARLQLPHYDGDLFKQVVEKNEFIFKYDPVTHDLIVYAPLQMLSKGNSLNRKFNGLIFIHYSLKRAITELRYNSLYSLIQMTFTLMISLLALIYILNKLIVTPLDELTKSATLIEFVSRTKQHKQGFGEIGLLQQACHLLSDEVSDAINSLATSEQRLLYAITGARDGVWDWNIAQQRVYLSEHWKEMLGYKNDNVSESIEEWEARIHEDDLLLVFKALQVHMSGKNSFYECTYRVRCYNGDYRWVLSRGQTVSWDENGNALRMIGTQTDISKYTKSHQIITSDEQINALTELPNRNQLILELDKERARSLSTNMYGAVILIECDQYKTINNLQDHHQVDQLLRTVAERIESLTTPTDFLSHISDSEFVIISPNLGLQCEGAAQRALVFTNQLVQILKEVILIDNEEVLLSCLYAIDIFPSATTDANELLRQATTTITFFDANHTTNIVFVDKALQQQIHQRQIQKNLLLHGLAHSEFNLYFEPRVDSNKQVIGAQAFIRWLQGAQGWVESREFSAMVEHCDLILPVGDWLIKNVFKQLVSWQEQGLPVNFTTISIKINAKQLIEDDFVKSIVTQLEKTQVDPSLFEIEISETQLLKHKQLTIDKLNELSNLGISIALDNFCTSYASFSYLSTLPISTFKLDPPLNINGLDDHNQQVILNSFTNMAEALNLQVIAQGIQSQKQLQFFTAVGCKQFQGDLIGPPLSKQVFQTLLFKK